MPERTHRLLDNLNTRIAELEKSFFLAWWDSQIEATEDKDATRAELELALRRFMGDPALLQQVNDGLGEDLHDEVGKRQLQILHRAMTGEQMPEAQREEIVRLSTSVESEFSVFRPQVDGRELTENDVEAILKTSNDAELREQTWRASKEIGVRVAERVRELARVRNAAARALGYPDFYRMELELQEIDEGWLFGLLGDLDDATRDPYAAWKSELDEDLRRRFATEQLYPWHYADPFFQNLPPDGGISLDGPLQGKDAAALALQTFDAWGIDLSSVLANSDLYPREKKCQHAFCLSVDRLDDVRILANIVPGERWIEVMLHECGHAAYDVSIERRLPFLLREPAHTFVTEAMALLCGRLVRDQVWLTEVAGASAEDVTAVAADLQRATAAQGLLATRWILVMSFFERELYSDPEADLDGLWWELVERFQLTVPPQDVPLGGWASKIHIGCAPVYYHNYLLGDVLASQLHATAERDYGGLVGSQDAGEFLVERLFKPGNSMRWDALIEQATGKPLSVEDFAAFVDFR
ncbi:MAG: M2 family metallopeptidase [Actinomycetota bacterium]